MKVDFNKIKDIYGENVLNDIKERIDDVKVNIDYLIQLGFNDVEDFFERVTLIFLYDKNDFKEKVDSLISKLGNDYVNIIESDIGVLEGM